MPGDRPAFVVRGQGDAPPSMFFLPGLCSNASAYLHAFPEAAKKGGGVVAIDGDQACVPGFRSFTWDEGKQNARIEAAFTAAGRSGFPDGGITLIGYSAGASIAERLVAKWPRRYTRLVLIAAPEDPLARRFDAAQAVVTMACTHDVTWRMKTASTSIAKRGVPSTFVEMPGCTHGNVAEGERVFGEVFAWLDTHALPPRPL